MANQKKSESVDMAAGSLPQRALKILAERLGHRSGMKIASTALSQSILAKITAAIGTDIPDAVFEVAGDAAAIFAQDPIIWKALRSLFGLDEGQAKELSNEGLDELITGFMDVARTHKGKTGKALDDALNTEADLTLDRLSTQLASRHPELLRKVWYFKRRHAAHEVGCENAKWMKGVEKGPREEGIPFAAVRARGGRMDVNCDCSDEHPPVEGSLQDALVACPPHVRQAFDRLLKSEEGVKQAPKILDAGNKCADITPDHIVMIVESGVDPVTMIPDYEYQLKQLMAKVGMPSADAAAPSDAAAFVKNLKKRGMEIASGLLAPRNDPRREETREKIRGFNTKIAAMLSKPRP